MKTEIFKDYAAFLARPDKETNGVSAAFAELHPDYVASSASNKNCWNTSRCYDCSDCSDCSGCSRCSGCSDCSGCYGCYGCSGCSDCSDCYGCSGCSGCSDCSDCSRCSGCYGCSDKRGLKDVKNGAATAAAELGKSWFDVPKIPAIHRLVLSVVEQPNALDMATWHTCDTTHCRGGWVVTLAGEKGKALEAASSTLFAAMQIYKASSSIKVSPVRFFERNEVAMADMRRCAEEEAKIAP